MTKPLRGIAVAGACALALLMGCSSDADPVDTPPVSETAADPQPEETQAAPEPEETVAGSTDPEPAEEPTESEAPEPTPEETEPEETEPEETQPAQGGWVHDEDADGARSATITTAGASLTFTDDPVAGPGAFLRSEEFTADYVNTVLCTELRGCGEATFQLGDQSVEHRFSRPAADDGDVRISFREPRDLWSLITDSDGVLQVVLVERATDAEVVFEFDITGADPDFL